MNSHHSLHFQRGSCCNPTLAMCWAHPIPCCSFSRVGRALGSCCCRWFHPGVNAVPINTGQMEHFGNPCVCPRHTLFSLFSVPSSETEALTRREFAFPKRPFLPKYRPQPAGIVDICRSGELSPELFGAFNESLIPPTFPPSFSLLHIHETRVVLSS